MPFSTNQSFAWDNDPSFNEKKQLGNGWWRDIEAGKGCFCVDVSAAAAGKRCRMVFGFWTETATNVGLIVSIVELLCTVMP